MMDQADEEFVKSRLNLDAAAQQLEDFHFKETRSDTQSSVILLGHRVKREYMSEFVLPDDTRIAVRRTESSMPADQTQVVIVSLSVGHPFDSLLPKFIEDVPQEGLPSEYESATTTATSDTSDDALSDSGDDERLEKLLVSANLRIADYLEDDVWAATILDWDSGANGELLRQLEAGCRLDPDSFRMERRQRRHNWKTIVDVQQEPQTRSLAFNRSGSEDETAFTSTTTLE